MISESISMIGIYLTIASILIVYEVFHLQTWVQAVDRLHDHWLNTRKRITGPAGTGERRILDQQCNMLFVQYPSLISYLLLTFITVLSVLGLILSFEIRDSIDLWYTAFPIAIFWGNIIASNGWFVYKRRWKIREIRKWIDGLRKGFKESN